MENVIKINAHESNYTKGRSGKNIELIAIHHMAGILTAEQCGNIFVRQGRGASSHYGIGNNGEIAQYVNESNTAWTNANWDSNCRSVTIETSNCEIGGDWKVSDNALNSLIKLVADISKRYNIILQKGKTVVWHRMYTNTTCPGEYLLSKIDYIIEEANKLNNIQIAQPSKSILELANEVINGKYGAGEARKQALGTLYTEVQAKVNEILLGNKPNLKSIDAIAREVIAGKWGNGQDRKDRLVKAGYNVAEVQARVNKLI